MTGNMTSWPLTKTSSTTVVVTWRHIILRVMTSLSLLLSEMNILCIWQKVKIMNYSRDETNLQSENVISWRNYIFVREVEHQHNDRGQKWSTPVVKFKSKADHQLIITWRQLIAWPEPRSTFSNPKPAKIVKNADLFEIKTILNKTDSIFAR